MNHSLTFKSVEIQFAKVARKQRKKKKTASKLTIEEMTELLQKKEIL